MRAMRVVRVVTNETCNQNCAFCTARRSVERRDLVAPAAVRARIDEAVRAGAQEIVLTGGEPLLRRDLPELVRVANASGRTKVALETNGALLDTSRLDALLQAGVTTFRIHLPAWGADCDAITRDDGGFDATLRALRLLTERAAPFDVSVPLVRANLSTAATLPRQLHEAGIRPRAVVASVPTEAPDETTLAPAARAVDVLERLAQACEAVEFGIRLDGAHAPPPCLLPHPGRLAHLFALTPGHVDRGTHARIEACSACVVRDRCPGMPVGIVRRNDCGGARPVKEDRTRRRFTVISTVEEQQERELVTRETLRGPDGREVPSHIVRVQFRCNQACHFCFVSTHLPSPPHERVREAIREATRGGGVLHLSGGEPTLNLRLVEYVRLGRESGAEAIELQTNAIRLADPELVAALAEAGVGTAFVSLHGSTAAVSDAVTAAPGTFDKTVAGLDVLARSPIAVRLNFVFCEFNRRDFPDYVRLVARRWPNAQLTVSTAGAFTDLVPRTTELIAKHSEVLAPLEEGLRIATEHGLRVGGWESMCGIPLCLLPPEPRRIAAAIADAPSGDGEFVKPPVCGSCAFERKCFGLRRSYVELYGTSELRPLDAAGQNAALTDTSTMSMTD